MARKSRKNKEEIEIRERLPEYQKERKIKVAGYVRLSSEQDENDSIETQKLMIKQYVYDRPEMELEELYCDDGYSGTNFARPDFGRMIQDAKYGRFDCIVVKDFSRFGRNYIEAGYYLETVLPRLGIRFISINDRFDSNREEDRNGITVPIKNLINSMYAADVSKKIVSNVELHNKLGDSKYRTSTFGYVLNRKDNRLEIDPVAAKYIKLIFYWYSIGHSTKDIAERLNAANVPIPSKYKEQFSNRKSMSKDNLWTNNVVGTILKHQVYIGNKVNGRQKTRLLENKNHVLSPKEEWYVHENAHEAIVSKELFESVNNKLDGMRDKYRESVENAKLLYANYMNCFAKKVVCTECGKTMTYVRKNKGSTQYGFQEAYYTCSRSKDDTCRQVVYEDYLKTIVLDQIKELIKYVCGQRDAIKDLREGRNDKSVLLSYEKMLINQKKKEADYDDLLANLYRDLADEVITEEEYRELSAKYTHEKEALSQKIKRTNESIYKMKKWIDAFEDLGNSFSSLMSNEADSQRIIDELVNKVKVSPDGNIEIIMNCTDVIERYRSLTEEENEADSHILKVVFGG